VKTQLNSLIDLRRYSPVVPPDNVDIVRSFYDAWARGELPVELLDPEGEYVNPAGAIEPGVRRGVEAFSEALRSVLEGWESWHMEPEELTAIGDQVAVVVAYKARGRTSGIEVEGRESALFTLRDGKVVRYEWFHGPDDAREAAGRSR
jgi:ketosteroid isomerase-like protein